ncbi:MAG: putative hemin transport protein [Granulosicoccus sp.]|jgi:putative hemin transport protein
MKNSIELKQNLATLKIAEPKLRARDLAERLNISEAELTSLSVGENVTRLVGDWKSLLVGMKNVGYVMALTRNESCVHERKGIYDNIKFYGGAHNMGVAVNPDIDLRFLMNEWKYGLAVEINRGKAGKLHAFQFFNGKGEAVHKIYCTPKSDLEAYENLVKLFTANEQIPITDVDTSPLSKKSITPDEEIDVTAFQESWKTLKDTHDFFGLIRKYNVTRIQGFRLAPEGFTQKIDNLAVVRALKNAVAQKVSIMCFLHSKGCIQIHTGKIRNLKLYGDWYNIMDKEFNLHLNLEDIAETWIVKKPTEDGIVTSLELFDKNGELIVYFFGERKPGKPELREWRNIIKQVDLVSKI